MTYDAANVIVEALAGVVRNGEFDDSSRSRLIDAVQRLPGGDHRDGGGTNKLLTVSTVKDGKFVPMESGEFESSS